MAAVDTMKNEGEGATENINITEWLKANKLSKLINYVEENEMTIENFLTYGEEDMELRIYHVLYILYICTY